MARSWTGLVLALLLGTAAACGDDTPAPPPWVASCDIVASLDICVDFYGTIAPTDQNDCTVTLGGTWSTTTPCPSANLTGTCTQSSGSQTFNFRFYPTNFPDDIAGAAACAQIGGTYTP